MVRCVSAIVKAALPTCPDGARRHPGLIAKAGTTLRLNVERKVDCATIRRQPVVMQKRSLFFLCFAAAYAAAPVFAHDAWLIADQMRVAAKTTVTLDLTSGVEFPKLDGAPKPENVPAASLRLDGKIVQISDKSAAANSLQFKTELAQAGVAAFWIKLPPRKLELKPEQVKMFNEEVNAPAELQQTYGNMPEPKHWRGTSMKNPKTFVRVGEPKNDTSWKEPVGLALEIVPEKDPTALRPGDEFPVRVLREGAPFAGFELNAVSEGDKKGETQKTDANGRATFRLTKAGRWLLKGVEAHKANSPDLDFEATSTTLTVEVSAK